MNWADLIIKYMRHLGYNVFTGPNEVNIVYIEGINSNFTPNRDEPDGWNDIRTVITFRNDIPYLELIAVATTEPGKKSTSSIEARRAGGVARIKFGQYSAWRSGFHKKSKNLDTHPALVQCANIPVYRDINQDGLRTGDPLSLGYGINQHSTTPIYKGGSVGGHSAGCLVGKIWAEHIQFLSICYSDPRYKADNKFVFSTTILPGDQFLKFVKTLQ